VGAGSVRGPVLGVAASGRWGQSGRPPVGILWLVEGRDAGKEAPKREDASFGAYLRALRQAAGLTQEELASRAGLSPNAVGALERGARRRPYPHTVRALSNALNLPEDKRAALLAAVHGQDDGPVGRADAGGGTCRHHPPFPPCPAPPPRSWAAGGR
jgi:DNA-binding XRE family transcriptional regulator